MKAPNYIFCQKKNAQDDEGYLFMRSKGRENKKKKSLGGIRVSVNLFKKYWNEKDQRFKSGMPMYKQLNEVIEDAFKDLEKSNNIIIPKSRDKNSFIKFWDVMQIQESDHPFLCPTQYFQHLQLQILS